jgi:hypothetical protein
VTLPRRIPKPAKRASRWKSPAHRAFVREHACCACDGTADRQFAHNRLGTDCGIAQKPDDWHGIVLCGACHRRQHEVGEATFDATAGIDRHALAAEFAKASPKAREIEQVKRERANG